MTTKGHPQIQEFPENSLEKIAYASVQSIPTHEPNDRNRLGYHVWLYLTHHFESLEEAVNAARARLLIPTEEAVAAIDAALKERLANLQATPK
ncbi:MAG: hypothetical protein ACP5JH_07635 [Bacteroidota bacterium]